MCQLPVRRGSVLVDTGHGSALEDLVGDCDSESVRGGRSPPTPTLPQQNAFYGFNGQSFLIYFMTFFLIFTTDLFLNSLFV